MMLTVDVCYGLGPGIRYTIDAVNLILFGEGKREGSDMCVESRFTTIIISEELGIAADMCVLWREGGLWVNRYPTVYRSDDDGNND